MSFTKQLFLSAVLLAVSTVQGHMKMASPIPYGLDSLNNSPLNADGSDFPCKLRSDTYSYTAETLAANTFHVGDTPTLSFNGSATHGGGSCQISLTTDLEPSATSSWMVIHSIEGGCPANVTGNMAGGADTVDPYTFNFPIPDIATGRYTLAWTWLNRIGNREFYMNCAPVLILPQSGSKKRETKALSERTDFPELFVANINGCTTSENVDIRYPNPGDSVEYAGAPSNLLPSGSPACTGGAGITATGTYPASAPTLTGTAIVSGGSGGGSGGDSAAPTVAPTAATTTAATVGGASTVQLSTSPTSSSGPAIVPAESPTSVVPAETSSPSTPSTSSSTSGGLSGACSTEGEWNCIGGTSFQRCASGEWSAVQPVAAGTNCTTGQSTDLNIVANKRDSTGLLHRRRLHFGNPAQ